MPFREKSAWVSLLCLLATFGLFFLMMAAGLIAAEGSRALEIFFACAAAFVVLQLVLRFVAVRLAPGDARALLDERERLIHFKATRNAWLVLIVGVLLVPASLHVGAHAPLMGYLAMAVLVVAEIVRAASRIFYFRKGA